MNPELFIKKIDERLASARDAKERVGLLLNKAVQLGILKRFEEARNTLNLTQQEIVNDPDSVLIFTYIVGGIHHQEGKVEEAFEIHTKMLSTYSRQLSETGNRFIYEDVQQQRAFEAAHLGRLEDAISLFEEILSFKLKNNDRAAALAGLGISYSKLKKYEPAREHLLMALKVRQAKNIEGRIHFHLALVCANVKLLRESKQELLLCEQHAAEWNLPVEAIYSWLSRISKHLGEKRAADEYQRLTKHI